MNRKTPLDVIQIKAPCRESWDAMTGDAKTRFCAGCRRHVHNLSAMPREEAERLVCESSGRLCVRYEVGADGAPVTLGYEKPGRIRGGWKIWTAVGAIGACLAGAAHAMIRPKPVPAAAKVQALMVMGDIAGPITPPPPPTTRPVLLGKIGPAVPPAPPVPASGRPIVATTPPSNAPNSVGP